MKSRVQGSLVLLYLSMLLSIAMFSYGWYYYSELAVIGTLAPLGIGVFFADEIVKKRYRTFLPTR